MNIIFLYNCIVCIISEYISHLNINEFVCLYYCVYTCFVMINKYPLINIWNSCDIWESIVLNSNILSITISKKKHSFNISKISNYIVFKGNVRRWCHKFNQSRLIILLISVCHYAVFNNYVCRIIFKIKSVSLLSIRLNKKSIYRNVWLS